MMLLIGYKPLPTNFSTYQLTSGMLLRDTTKAGLWTLDWTMDWTMDPWSGLEHDRVSEKGRPGSDRQAGLKEQPCRDKVQQIVCRESSVSHFDPETGVFTTPQQHHAEG